MDIVYRQATEADLEALIVMLSDDVLGAEREDTSRPLNSKYIQAFQNIAKDSNNDLILIEVSGRIAGMLQLTFIPYLTHMGSWRCLIESVRIDASFRGQGLGEQMFNWAINRAMEKGCNIVQLTADKKRSDAIRFYEKLGFRATHEGFKRKL